MKSIPLTLLLASLSCTASAQGFNVTIDSSNAPSARIHYPSDASAYFQIWGSHSITNVPGSVRAVELGQSGMKTWIDAGVFAITNERYYRVRRLPLGLPDDVDNDGIDDVYELKKPFLGPLDDSDAPLDEDSDGYSNLEEYQLGTNPEVPNGAVPTNGYLYPSPKFSASDDYADKTLSGSSGDFDGDGNVDLAVAIDKGFFMSTNRVAILLGAGDGVLQLHQLHNVVSVTGGVLVADLDLDTNLDVLTAGAPTITALMGDGNGNFSPLSSSISAQAFHLALAPLNAGSALDLIAARGAANNVSIHLGAGDGTFPTEQTVAVGSYPIAVTAGDLDGLGGLDVVVANRDSDNVSILLGNGDGTFQPQQLVPMGDRPTSVLLLDADTNGTLDLAVANGSSSNVSVRLGNGDGTFSAEQRYHTGSNVASLATSDLNGDGAPDLMAANSGTNTVSVLMGRGDGTFYEHQAYFVNDEPGWLHLADIDGDGREDLVTGKHTLQTYIENRHIAVHLGNGDGAFRVRHAYREGEHPTAIDVADFDSDGHIDLVSVNFVAEQLSLFEGHGNGTFEPRRIIPVPGGAFHVVANDINKDGAEDIITVNLSSNDVSILLGNGDGTFLPGMRHGVGLNPSAVAVADINNDTTNDLIVANIDSSDISVLLGTGSGSFGPEQRITAQTPGWIVAADLNADTNVDLVAPSINTTNMLVFLGNGDGTFQPPMTNHTGRGSRSVAAADFDGDGDIDLATANEDWMGADVSVFLGNGDGTFSNELRIVTGGVTPFSPATFVVSEDVDLDGELDLVVANGFTDDVSIHLGNGDGTFQSFQRYSAGTVPSYLVISDVDDNGRPDIIAVSTSENSISVLLHR